MRGEDVAAAGNDDGVQGDDGIQGDLHDVFLDAQDLADSHYTTTELVDGTGMENIDHGIQEMNYDNFDNSDDDHNAATMGDAGNAFADTGETIDDGENGRFQYVNLMNDDELEDISDHDIETMNVNEDKTPSGGTDSLNDNEMKDFLQLMKAVSGKGSPDSFREFLDQVEISEDDDVGSQENYLEDDSDDISNSITGVRRSDYDDDDIDGMVESSAHNEEDDSYLNNLLEFAQKLTEEELEDDENQNNEDKDGSNDKAVATNAIGGEVLGRHTVVDGDVNSAGHRHHKVHRHHKRRRHHRRRKHHKVRRHHRRHRHHKVRKHHRRHRHHKVRRHHRRHGRHRRHRRHRRRRRRRRHRHHKRHRRHRRHRRHGRHRRRRLRKLRRIIRKLPFRRVLRRLPLGRLIRRIPVRKILRKLHRKGKRLLKHLGHNLYYRRYHKLLKKYYHLRKKYYSLRSKHRRVKRACRKTTLKMVSNYCKKVRKKMNDFRKVYSKVRGCRNSRKCKFYEKTTNTTRSYYKFMYKLRPAAAMCKRLIEESKR